MFDVIKITNHMFCMKQQSRQEHMIYAALWGMLFMSPVISMYVRSVSDSQYTFEWEGIWMVWTKILVFLVLFAIHDVLLAPLLIYRRRRLIYFSMTLAIVAVFGLYQCTHHPEKPKPFLMQQDGQRPQMQQEGQRPPIHDEMASGGEPDFWSQPQYEHEHDPQHDPQHKPDDEPPFKPERPPVIIGEHDVVAILLLVLMFGANLGVKSYFKSRHDHEKLVSLEKENLEQQLEYLKYQINPHFFMNTLNNIHALVDIDPEKAKSTILELSKMMRFVLYEGDKKGVPLTREFDFVRNYITLMRLRYTDKVKINVDLPREVPDKQIPPLMLITFIENAFKHGISYQHDSFIDVKAELTNLSAHPHLIFTCKNSKADKPNQEKGGVGLTNVKQRLHLLYDDNYTLNIKDEPDIYEVELNIPL